MGSAYNSSLFSWLIKINLFRGSPIPYQEIQSICLGNYEESNRAAKWEFRRELLFPGPAFLAAAGTCHVPREVTAGELGAEPFTTLWVRLSKGTALP